MKHKVLFVDDEPQVTGALQRALYKEAYTILSAHSAEQGLAILARESVDVVISDEMMPGMPGSEFVALVRQKYPDTIRMILTGQASLAAAIRAINKGEIYRFLTKPCNEVDLAVTIRHALRHKDLMSECRRLLQTVRHQSAVLRELEKDYPGLTKVQTDESGAVILEDPGSDTEALIREIEAQLQYCEDLYKG